LGVLGALFEGKTTKVPVVMGLITNRRLFRLCYQTIPGRIEAFWMLNSDCNVLRLTIIALNNFIQYSHCQVVPPFRSTPFSNKRQHHI